jgi:hypothetical protein
MEDWERIREQYGPLVWKTVYKILESLFRVLPPTDYAVVRHTRGDPARGDVSVLVVSPETGIGPVKFGMSVDDVIRALGEPNWRKEHPYADNLQPRPKFDARTREKQNT